MNMDHGHLGTVFVEVHVVGDQPRLVSLDELDQLVHGCLELLELSLSDLRSVDVDDQAEGGREGEGKADPTGRTGHRGRPGEAESGARATLGDARAAR
jgi:hypothetical protein